MLNPESLLLIHRAAHAELLAELAAERRGGRRPSAPRRAADAVAAAVSRALAVRDAAVPGAGRRVELPDLGDCVACA